MVMVCLMDPRPIPVPLSMKIDSSSSATTINKNNNNETSSTHISCKGICQSSSSSCVLAKTVYVNEDQQQSRITTTGNEAKVVLYALRCLNCKEAFCNSCASLFSQKVKMCPCCAVMLEDI